MRKLLVTVVALACLAVLLGVGSRPGRGSAALAGEAIPMVSARPASTLVQSVGVGTHLAYPGTPYLDVNAVQQALTTLGVRHLRDNLQSGNPMQYAAMRQLAGAGMRFDLVMGRPDSWDTPQRLVDTLATSLPTGVVESVEGANEWNLRGGLDWVAELRAHQAALYAAVKANPVTRDLPVLAPSLGLRSGYAALGDLSRVVDLGNAHLYPGARKPSTLIDLITSAQQAVAPHKPVVFTESGYHDAMNAVGGHPPAPEDVVGIYAPRMLLDHILAGTRRLYLYELLDERPDPTGTDAEGSFGLLRNDFTAKPAYTALKNLLALTADPGPAFQPGTLGYQVNGGSADLRQLLLQKRDGTFVLLLWRDVSVYDRLLHRRVPVSPDRMTLQLAEPATVTVSRPSTSGDVPEELAGNAIPVTVAGGVVALQIRPGGDGTAGEMVEAPARVTAAPGDRRVDLSWSAPEGAPLTGYEVTTSPGDRTVRLPAGATKYRAGALRNGATYTFTLRALTATATSPVVTVESTPARLPSAPRAVRVQVDGRTVTVTWTPPRTDGGAPITGFEVMERKVRQSTLVDAGKLSLSLQWPDIDQRRGRFVVRAVNAMGHGPSGRSRLVRLP